MLKTFANVPNSKNKVSNKWFKTILAVHVEKQSVELETCTKILPRQILYRVLSDLTQKIKICTEQIRTPNLLKICADFFQYSVQNLAPLNNFLGRKIFMQNVQT